MTSLLKIAMSSLVLGATLVGNATGNIALSAPAAVEKGERQAAKLSARAGDALKAQDAAQAIALAEEAVALDPREADHRATLGQSYLQAGRFVSASTALRDALTLDPAHGRAALNLALAEIALGRNEAARAALAQARGLVADADYGLALALAGNPEAAIAILEAAARTADATPKTRQNLALAYALAGRWKEAHVIAAQDVPADQLPVRLAQWAQFARPQAASDQVASLLGVKPVADPGQPAQLALAPPASEPVAVAAGVAEPVAPVVAPAAADPVPAMAEAEARAARSIFLAAPAPTPLRKLSLPASKPVMQLAVAGPQSEAPARPAKRGNFVVQLGAFSSASRAEIAWGKLHARSRRLASFMPSSMKFVAAKATVYRLSVGGFATRAEASELCRQIKAGGGECFVRGVAGDAPMQWTARPERTRLASR